MAEIELTDSSDICLSGGADGADLQWGMCSGKAGHIVRHFIFEGHRSKAPKEELVVLTSEQLLEADAALKKANKTLKRSFPTRNNFVNSLFRRNYYQVSWANSVYAVANIENGMVSGGTSWAVQMFIDRFDGKPCPAYVYDQATSVWFSWDGADKGWNPCVLDHPPKPTGIWAGIGSRDLKDNGKDAIRNLLGYVKTSAVT